MKWKLLMNVIMVLLFMAGCSANNESAGGVDNDLPGEIDEQGIVRRVTHKQENTLLKSKQNNELTMKLKAEKGVMDGQVYTQNNMAIGTLVLDRSISNEAAQKLAEKYVAELKREYKNMRVNVQAVRDGEDVITIIE